MSIEYINFPWKGRTFTQITSAIKRNVNNLNYGNGGFKKNAFLPNPLKIYRREIAVMPNASRCNPRTSASTDVFNQPGGSIINSGATTQNGIPNTVDNIVPNNTCEEPGTCLSFLSPSDNARKRVRSSGMIPKKYDASKNNDQYCTSTNQYLVSRNRTFSQNQYNFIRQGNSAAKPGDSLSSANVYSPNGISHCSKYFIASDCSFVYQWIDKTYNTVTIPRGKYTVEDINTIFQDVMISNNHYYIIGNSQYANNLNRDNIIYRFNQNIVLLLKIAYNSAYNKIELQTSAIDTSLITNDYVLPLNATWTTPTVRLSPIFHILNNVFQQAIGFSQGYYPNHTTNSTTSTATNIPITNVAITNVTSGTTKQVVLSSSTPGLQSAYVKLYYKPNNPQFAQQGGVSSSTLTHRLKYDTITNSITPYRNAYGTVVANSLAYYEPVNGHLKKSGNGYPNHRPPLFSNTSNEIQCRPVNRRSLAQSFI